MKSIIKYGVICFIILIGLLFILNAIGTSYYTEHSVTDKVIKTERVQKGGSSYYLVYGANETYTIRDSYIKWRFNSSDVYGHIIVGNTYKFKVYGWRSGFFSMYRNIIYCEEV